MSHAACSASGDTSNEYKKKRRNSTDLNYSCDPLSSNRDPDQPDILGNQVLSWIRRVEGTVDVCPESRPVGSTPEGHCGHPYKIVEQENSVAVSRHGKQYKVDKV